MLFMFCVFHAFVPVHCYLVVTCLSWLLFVMFNCVFVTFPSGILGKVWYLIVSIPDICRHSYFDNGIRTKLVHIHELVGFCHPLYWLEILLSRFPILTQNLFALSEYLIISEILECNIQEIRWQFASCMFYHLLSTCQNSFSEIIN